MPRRVPELVPEQALALVQERGLVRGLVRGQEQVQVWMQTWQPRQPPGPRFPGGWVRAKCVKSQRVV